jgi:hypothetical protein
MAIEIDGQTFDLVWVSDVNYDGIRLEAWFSNKIMMDVACGDDGRITLSTWEKDVPLKLVETCIALGRGHLLREGIAER